MGTNPCDLNRARSWEWVLGNLREHGDGPMGFGSLCLWFTYGSHPSLKHICYKGTFSILKAI